MLLSIGSGYKSKILVASPEAITLQATNSPTACLEQDLEGYVEKS
jgi:hypothetical protein